MSTKKKTARPKSYQITPEIHQRAVDSTVLALIHKASDLGKYGQQIQEARSNFGVSASTAHIVCEASAQMLIWLARQIDSGAIVLKCERA